MNYGKYAAKAREKVRKYGSPCRVVRSGGKEYNRETNEYEGVDVILEGFALQSSFSQKDIDGTNIRSGDILLMCVLDGRPESNDSVEYGGRKYTAVNVSPLSPNGKEAVYYKVQAR